MMFDDVFEVACARECLMDRTDRSKHEPVEVVCPQCRYTEIIYLPADDLPLCPRCGTRMSLSELLDEGKSY